MEELGLKASDAELQHALNCIVGRYLMQKMVDELKQEIEQLTSEFKKVKYELSNFCSCPLKVIFDHGCQCGGQ